MQLLPPQLRSLPAPSKPTISHVPEALHFGTISVMAIDELAERRADQAFKRADYRKVIEVLMDSYGSDIYRFCLSMMQDHMDAEDILQTVFMQAFDDVRGFKRKSAWRTWLYSIARHRCLDRLKIESRRRQRVEFVAEPPEVEQSQHVVDPAMRDAIQRCLTALPQEVRQIVVLRFIREHTYADCQRLLEEDAGTLQARAARALPKLRRCLQDCGALP